MRPIIESKPRSTDHPAMQRYAARPQPAEVVEVAADVFETTAEEIRNSHGTVELRVAARYIRPEHSTLIELIVAAGR